MGVYNRQPATVKTTCGIKMQLYKKRPLHNVLLSKQSLWKWERQGLVGSLRNSPTRRARQRSRITASSRMRHSTSSYMLYMHVYYIPSILANSISHRPSNNIYVFSNTWMSMQSGNETNDPLKSGPTKARPARPVTLPLIIPGIDSGE